MSSNNELKEYNDEELLAELDRRKKIRAALPKVDDHVAFGPVVEFYVRTMEKALVEDNLDLEAFQEDLDIAVGKAIFGPAFGEWRRKQTF